MPTPTAVTINSGNTGATLIITIPTSIPAGAIIVACIAEASSTVGGSMTDGVSNSYTASTAVQLNGVAANGFSRIFYATNKAALATAMTYTRATSGSVVVATVFYIDGTTGGTPLDNAVTNSATGTGTAPSVTSGTPTQSGDLVLGFVAYGSSTAGTQDPNSWNSVPSGSRFSGLGIIAGTQVDNTTGTLTYAPTIPTAPWAAFTFGFSPNDLNPNFIGKFYPPQIKVSQALRQNTANDVSLPPSGIQEVGHNIIVYPAPPGQFPAYNQFYNNKTEDVPPPNEAITDFIGRFTPQKLRGLGLYSQNTSFDVVEDTPAPNFIGRFRAPKISVSLFQGVSIDSSSSPIGGGNPRWYTHHIHIDGFNQGALSGPGIKAIHV